MSFWPGGNCDIRSSSYFKDVLSKWSLLRVLHLFFLLNFSNTGNNGYVNLAQGQSISPPPPTVASITNGVVVNSTIRFADANLTAIASSTTSYAAFQSNFQERLIVAAQNTGYSGQLQVSITNIVAVSVVGILVDSTVYFAQATSYTQPQALADTLTNQVQVVFAASSYFTGLKTGLITSYNVTVTAASSDAGTAKGASTGISFVIWIVLGVGGALVIAAVCILYIRYRRHGEEDYEFSPAVEENEDIDYDPQEAYAQLVAEAQGYERQHPNQQVKDETKVSMPAMPEDSPWAKKLKGTKQPSNNGRRSSLSIFPIRKKATSGPVMFTSTPDSLSGPVFPPKSELNGGERPQTPVGGAPNRMRNLIRSISGPIKVVWPSPSQASGAGHSRLPSGNWSGLLSSRWSGMLAPQNARASVGSSMRYSGQIDLGSKKFSGPVDGSAGGSRRGGGVGDVARDDVSEKSAVSSTKAPPRPPLAPGTESPASRRVFSGPLSFFSTPGRVPPAPPPEADVSPFFTPGQKQDSAAEPPQPMAMLRSDSHKGFRGSSSLRDLDFPSGMMGGGDSSSSLAQMRRPQHPGISANTGGGGRGEVRRLSGAGGSETHAHTPTPSRRQETTPAATPGQRNASSPVYFA